MANTYAGKNAYLLFGVESTFNTEATSIIKDIGVVNNVNPDFNNNIQVVNQIGNRESCENIAGNFEETIGIDGTLNSGAIFELFFGQSSDNQEGATGDYSHIFVDADNDEGFGASAVPLTAASFSMSENFNSTADIQYTYTGCKFNTLDISVETGGVLEFSSEVIGTTVSTDASVGTQVSTNTKKLAGFNADILTGALDSEVSVGQTKSVSLSLNNNIDPSEVKAIGSRFNQDLIENNLDITAEFTKTFANDTEFQLFLGGTSPSTTTPTPVSLNLSINNGVALGSGRVELFVKLEGGQYESTNHTVGQDGVVEETFNYINGNLKVLKFVDAVTTYF